MKRLFLLTLIVFGAVMVLGKEFIVEKAAAVNAVVPLQAIAVVIIFLFFGAILLRKKFSINFYRVGDFFLAMLYIVCILLLLAFWGAVIYFFVIRG